MRQGPPGEFEKVMRQPSTRGRPPITELERLLRLPRIFGVVGAVIGAIWPEPVARGTAEEINRRDRDLERIVRETAPRPLPLPFPQPLPLPLPPPAAPPLPPPAAQLPPAAPRPQPLPPPAAPPMSRPIPRGPTLQPFELPWFFLPFPRGRGGRLDFLPFPPVQPLPQPLPQPQPLPLPQPLPPPAAPPQPQPFPSPEPDPLTRFETLALGFGGGDPCHCEPGHRRRRDKRPSNVVANVKTFRRRMSQYSLDNLRRG